MRTSPHYITRTELKDKKNYYSLKDSCSILYQELSTVKEKNDSLNQRVKELETIISSIFERTITKEEMKEMIKEGLTPLINILTKEKIKGIEEVIQSDELDTSKEFGCVSSLIETEDKRIASGGTDGSISVSSYNVDKKKWKRDVYKRNAHNKGINSLCTLIGNRLVSGSVDFSIKVWNIFNKDITLIKGIKENTNTVYKVIPLSKERFASCSYDYTVRIWKDDSTYECISTLKHNGEVKSILQLRGKKVLVSCGSSIFTGVSFWNLNDYTQQHTIEGYSILLPTHMKELYNGDIALSSKDKSFPIIIIDGSSYQVKK